MISGKNVVAAVNRLSAYCVLLLFGYLFVGTTMFVLGMPDYVFALPVYLLCNLIWPGISWVSDDYLTLCGCYYLFLFFLLFGLFAIQSSIVKMVARQEPAIDRSISHLTPVSRQRKDAEAMMHAGNYSGAARELQAIIRKSPGYPDAHYNLGYCYMMMPDYAAAVSEFHEELKIRPDSFNSRLNAGFCNIRLARADYAIRELEEAKRLKPDSSAVHYQLATGYRLAGRQQDAAREYVETKKLDQDLEGLDLAMGENYLDTGALDDAIAALKIAVIKKPDSDQAHYKLGLALCKKGRYDDALAEYNRAIKINPAEKEYCDMLEVARAALRGALSSSPATKEVVREIVKVPCKYCGSLLEITSARCPSCGAPLK